MTTQYTAVKVTRNCFGNDLQRDLKILLKWFKINWT